MHITTDSTEKVSRHPCIRHQIRQYAAWLPRPQSHYEAKAKTPSPDLGGGQTHASSTHISHTKRSSVNAHLILSGTSRHRTGCMRRWPSLLHVHASHTTPQTLPYRSQQPHVPVCVDKRDDTQQSPNFRTCCDQQGSTAGMGGRPMSCALG